MAFRRPSFRVEVNGTDYTSRFDPLVKSIDVTDKDGLTSDTCSITLADTEGSIIFPSEGDRLKVYLGIDGAAGLVFSGFIDEVTESFSKGGGFEMKIGAKGVDSRSKAKEPMQKHKDDAKFGDVAKEWGRAAGLDMVMVSEALASIQSTYWAMQGESFIHWGQRVARDIGATFKIQDGKAMFVETNGGKTASGQTLPTIVAAWADNLLSGEISPVVSRPRHKKVTARYYDPKAAKWKETDAEISDSGSEADHIPRFTAPDEETAKRKAKALKTRSERNSGEGSVTILGTPDAKPEGICQIVGVRPGVDGSYRIEGVTHKLTRSGYTTSLDLKQPHGDAGKDNR